MEAVKCGRIAMLMSCLTGCWQQSVVPSQPPNLVRPMQPELGTPTPDLQQESASPSSTGVVPDGWKPIVSFREWESIMLHHTASPRGSVESIHEAHRRRKDGQGNYWMGIGYHFVIGNGDGMGDGEIEPTFRWREQLHGAHSGDSQYNEHGIGIVLVGNFDQSPPSPRQLAAVKRLVEFLREEYDIPVEKVIGHSDVKATACPGKLFPLEEVRRSGWDRHLGRTD